MKKIMKEITPKLILAAILATCAGAGSIAMLGMAYAEDRHDENEEYTIENKLQHWRHGVQHQIDEKRTMVRMIVIGPNSDHPTVMQVKLQLEQEIKELDDSL